MRLPVHTVIRTTLVGLEPATFRSLVDCWSDAPPVVPPTYSCCVAFGDNCQVPCSSRWWHRLFSVGWTTVTACWSYIRDISPSASSLFKTPLSGSSLESAAHNTLLTPSLMSALTSHLVQSRRSDLQSSSLSSPRYMSSCFTRVVNMPSRWRVKTHVLNFPPATCITTVSKQDFPFSGAYLWSDLPLEVTSVAYHQRIYRRYSLLPSLAVFRKWLNTLFPLSFSWLI